MINNETSKNKLALFVVSHKQINIEQFPGRKIIYVGNNNFPVDLIRTFSDKNGISISEKNNVYCELTAIYWIWKNYNDAEYVGIEHYRRNFYKGSKIASIDWLYNKAQKYDFIHFQTFYHPWFTEKQRVNFYEGKTLIPLLRKAVENTYPEYLNTFDRQMKSRYCTYCNIFICKKELFNKYAEFLFNILAYVEKHIDEIAKDEQPRSLGYMAERLFDTFLKHNNYSHKSSLVHKNNRWNKK